MNTKKTAITIVAAMMAIAMITTVAMAVICEKPCGTKVLQCDKETTFVLYDADDVEIVTSDHGFVYVDMDRYDGNTITAGDIRLTGYHNYTPNTKVGTDGSDDLGDDIVSNYDQDIITYLDINSNGKFDLYDPVYVDLDDSQDVSQGDIRITAVPPVDVYYRTEDALMGTIMYTAGEWFDSPWTVVAHVTSEEDYEMSLWEVGTEVGSAQNAVYADDVIKWMDGDCTGDWTCQDKLYITQPHFCTCGDNGDGDGCYSSCHYDGFVTIGDTRLYIPLDDECVPDCGTKVTQASKDAVYALTVNTGARLAYATQSEPTEREVYINMDDDDEVSFGDVRLTNVSTVHPPNSKVTWCNQEDLGHDLTETDQYIIRYYDLDSIGHPALNGYSLGDPLYVDMDDDNFVSDRDIRLTDCPIFDMPGIPAGSYGLAWSIVEDLPGIINDDPDVGEYIESLPTGFTDGGVNATVNDLLGYIDSDCSGDWTCPDKLYLQQLVDTRQHDLFVTVGDHRLYIPPEAIDEEGWPPCGTKVEQCDIDQVYSLMSPDQMTASGEYMDPIMAGWYDMDGQPGFGITDHAYLDMDGDEEVSGGDIRLTTVVREGVTYAYNTKVKAPHDKDLTDALRYGNGFTCDVGGIDIDVPLGVIIYVDMNENGVYDVSDPLYMDTDWFGPGFGFGVTQGDIRLTDVPLVPYGSYGTGDIGPAWSRVIFDDPDTNWQFFRDTLASIVYDGWWRWTIGDFLMIFDSDCSGTWTCVDKVYLQQPVLWGTWPFPCDEWCPEWDHFISWKFVTAGDHRLYMPPGNDTPPVEPADWCEYYDMIANGGNNNGITEITEAWNAIQDYVAGTIDPADAWEVIQCYLADR